jgi:hypothetical protein
VGLIEQAGALKADEADGGLRSGSGRSTQGSAENGSLHPVRPRCSLETMRALASDSLALQLFFLESSESIGNHDSNVVGAGRVG